MATDTRTRTATEGDVDAHGVGVDVVRRIGIEALGIEGFGIVPEHWIPVKRVSTKGDHGAFRDDCTADVGVFFCVAVFKPERRMQAHGFVDDATGEVELFEMFEEKWAVSFYSIDLVDDLAFDFGMAGEFEESRYECGG